MPNIEWNKSYWSDLKSWKAEGEEWSAHWGSSFIQWHYTILPRIAACLPASRIIEIAPGFGRWTRFLLPLCNSYRGYDLSDTCIASCRQRFMTAETGDAIDFVANDGRSLPLEANASADFIFSFDSLVHVEQDVIASYLGEIARVLKPSGRAFLHHSNLGGLPKDLPHYAHERGQTVSAASVARAAKAAGLLTLAQETVTWNIPALLDCFSLVAKPPVQNFESPALIENKGFWEDVAKHRDILRRYHL
jgi:SAM-dependent methyltransferase